MLSVVKQYDYNGKNCTIARLGSAGGFKGKKRNLDYSFFTTLGTIYPFEISSISKKPKVDFKSEDFESKQVFYTSKTEPNPNDDYL
jgi:prolyl oligopeptidase